VLGVDWQELFSFSVPVAELVVRGTAMYWFLFLLFRFVVRRDAGGMGMADILVLVIVADAAQNAMAGEYRSIVDGMALVGTIVFWNYLLDWLCFRFPAIERVLQPRPLLLVKDGQIQYRNMRRQLLTHEELMSKIREQGVDELGKVKRAYMEEDGKVSVVKTERR
jgi:uncharacterized membrane protein YcaP (DUF421 family)